MTPSRLRVFPAISRNRDPQKYVGELMRVAQFADRNGFEGILLFEGNDVFVEPWAMAQHIMAGTTRCSPLIAVNPVYMHPFTAAKFVSSFAQLYGRKIYLNMITGTAVSDLQGLGDDQSHADRYLRLGEFVALMRQLLASPRPVNFKGRFYRASNLQLRPRLPADLMPEFLIAGQSEAAQRVAKETGCIKMQMLPPDLDRSEPGEAGWSDRAEALNRCVGRLGEAARDLLRMRYADGMTAAAIADAQSRTAAAVYQTLSRIHRSLRRCVERELAGSDRTPAREVSP